MRSVERAPGVRIGDRVLFWVQHPAAPEQHWQEGVVNQITQIHDDWLLTINSFGPRPIWRWISEVMREVPDA